MKRALVYEPIRVPNENGKLTTFRPTYKAEGKSNFKICPQVEIPEKHYDLFLREGHVRPAIGKAAEVVFTGKHPNWKPVTVSQADNDGEEEAKAKAAKAKAAEEEAKAKAAEDEAAAKGGKPSHNRAADSGQTKKR